MQVSRQITTIITILRRATAGAAHCAAAGAAKRAIRAGGGAATFAGYVPEREPEASRQTNVSE